LERLCTNCQNNFFHVLVDYGTPIHPTEFDCERETIRITQDIETRPVWKPIHLQPIFQKYETIGGEVAANLFDRGLCLPSGSNLTEAELDRVIKAIQNCQQN
jgi:dTDP-4-amino-4,6-dideoxygalactose transaminase